MSKSKATRATKHDHSERAALIGYRKGALVLGMIATQRGATLMQLMKATGWQAHSIRGFIATARHHREILSFKDEEGQRRYLLE